MKNYLDSKIPKSISRPILGALTAAIVIFIIKSLFDISPAVNEFVYYVIYVLFIGSAIYMTFFKKSKK